MKVVEGLYRAMETTVTRLIGGKRYVVWCVLCDRWIIDRVAWTVARDLVEEHEAGHPST